MRRTWVIAAAVVAAGLAAACTSSGGGDPTQAPSTRTTTITRPRPTPPSPSVFAPAPARSVTPLPPGRPPPSGEVEKACPYVASTPGENPDVNVADMEGDHVYRTTVLTELKPVGCRFYFYSGPYEAIADILPQTFPTPVDAHNAMVKTAEAGANYSSRSNIVKGVDAIVYQTAFYGQDGNQDWACVFAKGKVMVVVHTQQTNISFNAVQIATAIAPKF
jgi:hypothetical protein